MPSKSDRLKSPNWHFPSPSGTSPNWYFLQLALPPTGLRPRLKFPNCRYTVKVAAFKSFESENSLIFGTSRFFAEIEIFYFEILKMNSEMSKVPEVVRMGKTKFSIRQRERRWRKSAENLSIIDLCAKYRSSYYHRLCQGLLNFILIRKY